MVFSSLLGFVRWLNLTCYVEGRQPRDITRGLSHMTNANQTWNRHLLCTSHLSPRGSPPRAGWGFYTRPLCKIVKSPHPVGPLFYVKPPTRRAIFLSKIPYPAGKKPVWKLLCGQTSCTIYEKKCNIIFIVKELHFIDLCIPQTIGFNILLNLYCYQPMLNTNISIVLFKCSQK